MNTVTYQEALQMTRHLTLADRVRLLEALAHTIRLEVADKPSRSILELEGLGQEMWRQIDVDQYIQTERDSWASPL
ncbi:MAG: hypothetical protein OT477_06670 [Chloroflexi bacterium]|nr:hypothetical protein [Chloroflexota bacterium]